MPEGLFAVSSFPAERVRKASTKPLHHLEYREIFAASCEPPQGQSSDIVARNWLSIEAIEQSANVRKGSSTAALVTGWRGSYATDNGHEGR